MSTVSKVAAFLGVPPPNVVRLDDHRSAPAPLPQAELDLGDATCVVPPKAGRRAAPAVVPSTSAAFERAWSVYPDALKRSTRKLSWPKWVVVAHAIGEERLEAAVAAYARDPFAREQRLRNGAPGFQVWLGQGRWEHYLDVGAAVMIASVRSVPNEVWDAVAGRWGADYAGSWLHKARMSETRPGSLVAWTGTAADRLARECRAELAAAGVTLIVAVKDNVVIARHAL